MRQVLEACVKMKITIKWSLARAGALAFCALGMMPSVEAKTKTSLSPELKLSPGVAPRDVLSRLPRGAHSLGFATAPLGPGGSTVMLFFHGVPVPHPTVSEVEYDTVSLDILARSSRGSSRKGLSLLRSFQLPGVVEAGGAIRFELIGLYWLQPRLKRGPVLMAGGSSLQVMPRGWKGRLRTIDMDSYSNARSAAFFLDSTDSRGYARLRVEEMLGSGLDVPTGPDGGSATSSTSYLYWNGQGFASPRGAHR